MFGHKAPKIETVCLVMMLKRNHVHPRGQKLLAPTWREASVGGKSSVFLDISLCIEEVVA